MALLLSGMAGGGAQRRMITLANRFAADGHDVDLVAIRGNGAFRAQIDPSVHLVALDPWLSRLPGLRNKKSSWVLAGAPAIAAYLRRTRPDVLLSSSNPANLAALWARWLARTDTPVVLTVNVHVSRATAATESLHRRFLRQLVRRGYPHAERIIAVTQSLADDLQQLTGVSPSCIVTIANPIAAGEIAAQAAQSVSHPWLQPGEPPVLLAVGKLKRQKDFETLIRAFARLRTQRPARLLILGEGEERPRLEALAQHLGVAADVSLPGFTSNPFPYMARAAAFVLSSRWEGFSNVLAEAMACGCPVVSTDCPGGPAEFLERGNYGPLVPVGDAQRLAAAMEAILANPPERERLQARAREFPVEEAAQRYLEVLWRAYEDVRRRVSVEPHRGRREEVHP